MTPKLKTESLGAQGLPEWVSLPVSMLTRGDRRLDGEAYLAPGFIYRQKLAELPEAIALSRVAAIWQPSRLKGVQVAKGEGVPFLAATQVFDTRPRPRKWLSKAKTPDLSERLVEEEWLLITRSGSVGNAVRAYSPHQGPIISDDLLRIQANSGISSTYLYAFLRTSYGREMMRASNYGNVIKHLEVSHLMDLPIVVVPSKKTRARVEDLIEKAYSARDAALRAEYTAEEMFADAVGFVPNVSLDTPTVIRSPLLGKGRRRLDGYFYNSVADAILRGFERAGLETEPLRDVCAAIRVPGRFKRGGYVSRGVPYLDSEDIFKVNPEVDKFLAPAVAKKLGEYYVKRQWVLVACSGQIYGINGSMTLATEWHEDKVLSQHILRIVPSSEVRPGYIKTALGHASLGRPLVIRNAYGTSVPEIDPGDLAETPLVRLDGDLEEAIADEAEEAARLRYKADEQEQEAVSLLEADVRALL